MKRYGKRYDELHSWMDEPWEVLGKKHRMYRHDPITTPRKAKELFGEYADDACLDHILLDFHESPQRFKRNLKPLQDRFHPQADYDEIKQTFQLAGNILQKFDWIKPTSKHAFRKIEANQKTANARAHSPGTVAGTFI